MFNLKAKIRKDLGKKTKALRKNGVLPAIFYGPKMTSGRGKKALPLEINLKEFEKIYQQAGESTLISLEVEEQKTLVLIHEVQRDPITSKPIHVDFYQPILEKEITAKVPLVFEGLSPAVKDLGGTLVKDISEVEVRALPQNLPKEIKVMVESLKTFEDNIKISDLKTPEGVKILKKPEEIVASVSPLEKVEEELVKPIEEKVEEVEKVEKKEKVEEKEVVEETKEEKK
jgi:large subunit ribosomal protein L25